MADYINRETAIQTAEHAYHEWNLAMAAADGQRQINRCYKMQELCKAVASVFVDTPLCDVAPVRHGRWEAHFDYEDFIDADCSVCGERAKFMYKYCPYCGALMDGGEEDG